VFEDGNAETSEHDLMLIRYSLRMLVFRSVNAVKINLRVHLRP
jgi:hypothetical protein